MSTITTARPIAGRLDLGVVTPFDRPLRRSFARSSSRPSCRRIDSRIDSQIGSRGTAPRRAPVSEATYRRRRAVVGTVLAVLIAVGAVATHDVLAGSGGVPASAAASQPAHSRTTVTARPGDTLWSLAERHRGEVPVSRYVDALVSLNGGASIQAGQAVVLP